jgi:hypothetical protein
MENTETTIVADERILSISVHGSDRNKDNAIEMLTDISIALSLFLSEP